MVSSLAAQVVLEAEAEVLADKARPEVVLMALLELASWAAAYLAQAFALKATVSVAPVLGSARASAPAAVLVMAPALVWALARASAQARA